MQGPIKRADLRTLWPWLGLWVALALLAIFSHGPMAMHSARTLSVAWEMWVHGNWLVPHLNGAPYADKVPLLYWLIHLGWAIGGVGDVWPRLLAVLIGAIQLLLAWRLARRWYPPDHAVSRDTLILMVAFSFAFLFAIQIMYDGLLAVWVLAALLCLVETQRGRPRFAWLALFLGLGLLSKGPVMLLHVLAPWLLGPVWSDTAAANRSRWYSRGSLALLAGCAIFALWLVPAMWLGGDAYRDDLLFNQTAGRVVDAFDHAQPWWWYGPRLLVLLLPFAAWPRFWVALGSCLRRPLPPAVRFALCWLVPVLLAFSAISGKQAYYLIPEMAALALLGAVALDQARARQPWWWQHRALGPWLLALGAIALAATLAGLPWWVSQQAAASIWLRDLAPYAPWFAPLFLLLGVLAWAPLGRELRRICCAGLLGTFALHALFTCAWWQRYDLAPAARVLAQAESEDRAIAIIGLYEGQYHFLGRLRHPIERIHDYSLPDWTRDHPRGIVITDPAQLPAAAPRRALLLQPFRSRWVILWRATELAAAQRGRPRDGK